MLREPIVALARANQIPVDKVFVVDASRQTTRISANVAGFLGTTRIALNDNLLRECTLPEIRQVMGHEMGHYVLNHGVKLALYHGVFFLIGSGLTSFVFAAVVRNRGEDGVSVASRIPPDFPCSRCFWAPISFFSLRC